MLVYSQLMAVKRILPQVGFTYMITLELNFILFFKYKLTLLKYSYNMKSTRFAGLEVCAVGR